MTPTEAGAKVRELLPCDCGYEIPTEYGHGFTHAQGCPATRRPSLAAALTQAHAAGLAQGRAEGREEAARWHEAMAQRQEANASHERTYGVSKSFAGMCDESANLHREHATAIRSLKP